MIKTTKWDAVDIETYNGKYSLVLGWEGRDGKFNAKWAEFEMGKDKIKKKMPVKIPLGDSKEEAAAVLKTLFLEMSE